MVRAVSTSPRRRHGSALDVLYYRFWNLSKTKNREFQSLAATLFATNAARAKMEGMVKGLKIVESISDVLEQHLPPECPTRSIVSELATMKKLRRKGHEV